MIPVGTLAGQSFQLCSSDHVDYFYSDIYPKKYVHFYHFDDEGRPLLYGQKPSEDDMLYGDVDLHNNVRCSFGPFRPPEHASREPFKLMSDDGVHELSFTFMGNGYLELSVSREMLLVHRYSARPLVSPAGAPDVFKFAGVLPDKEKEIADWLKRIEQETGSRKGHVASRLPPQDLV